MASANEQSVAHADRVHQRFGELWEQAAIGWTRWEPHLVGSMWPVTHALMDALHLSPGMRVLDVGSGIGDPAIPIAAAIGATGRVQGVDLSPAMVAACRDRARAYGLTNATFQVGAVEEVEFAPGSFDAAVGRFSIIFFPDVAAGLGRLRDALKPGGRIAVSTWTPPDVNPGFALPSRELRKLVELPPSDPTDPGPFRLARDGELAAALSDAGFVDVAVKDVVFYMFARDADAYWEMLQEISAMFREQYAKLSADKQRELEGLIRHAVEAHRSGNVLRLPMRARVGSGVKPQS
ncbi:MAG: methyltransferase domain-containing protein [Phycisphaerales bacterium]|nr:methyltransferase domain-containing protein [Phycisphaerales bacterium]